MKFMVWIYVCLLFVNSTLIARYLHIRPYTLLCYESIHLCVWLYGYFFRCCWSALPSFPTTKHISHCCFPILCWYSYAAGCNKSVCCALKKPPGENVTMLLGILHITYCCSTDVTLCLVSWPFRVKRLSCTTLSIIYSAVPLIVCCLFKFEDKANSTNLWETC